MSDAVRMATRDSYGKALVELGKINDKVYVLDADLAGATKTGVFKKEFPDRHIDCGIAEANMMGIAAGLSTTGLIPFCSSFAMFATGRAYEQVRNSIGYPHLNVKIGGTHAGIIPKSSPQQSMEVEAMISSSFFSPLAFQKSYKFSKKCKINGSSEKIAFCKQTGHPVAI